MKGFERFKHTIHKSRKNFDAAPKKKDATSLKATTVALEGARMNTTLSSLMEKLKFCYMVGQTADENLLLEVES
jgi:hypothetical protein